MTDAGLKELAGLKSLQSLNLRFDEGDGRGAEGAGRTQEPADAGPFRTKVTDAALRSLMALNLPRSTLAWRCGAERTRPHLNLTTLHLGGSLGRTRVLRNWPHSKPLPRSTLPTNEGD